MTSGGEARKFILHSAWIRPSKLRLPDSTEHTVRSCPVTAALDLRDQRAGVSDAGGAAVTDQVEAELLEVRGEPGPVVVVGDDAGPGRERGLHPGLAGQAPLHGVLGQQRRADHHRRIGGVGARRDRGDDHVPVVHTRRGAVVEGHRHRVGRPVVCVLAALGIEGARRREATVDRDRVAGRERLRRCLVEPALHRRGRWLAGQQAPDRVPCGRRAGSGPAAASARRSRAPRSPGPARPSGCRPVRAPGRATVPAPWRRPRRAGPAVRSGRSAAGSSASRRRWGRSRRSSRTPGSCCRSSPGWPAARWPRRGRRTRRTCRPRWSSAAVRRR